MLYDRNLVETLKCFKVIGNCLKEIYAGETYMCRVLSVQLRMLLCDYSNKSEPLLLRLIPGLELQTFEHVGCNDKEISAYIGMPFEVRCYWNGVEDSLPILGKELLPLNTWINQIVLAHPVPITIERLIKIMANKEGGAHVDKDLHPLIMKLQETVFRKLNQGDLIILGLAKVVQQLIFQIIQENGKYLNLDNINKNYLTSIKLTKVPKECFEQPFNTAQLLMLHY